MLKINVTELHKTSHMIHYQNIIIFRIRHRYLKLKIRVHIIFLHIIIKSCMFTFCVKKILENLIKAHSKGKKKTCPKTKKIVHNLEIDSRSQNNNNNNKKGKENKMYKLC